MKIFAKAKINLCLDILGKDKSGYHKIQTVYKELDFLANEVEILEAQDKANMSRPKAPESETCKMAIHLMQKRFNKAEKPIIDIKRNIPFSSGLGGEASNAAAIIKGLNQVWGLKLNNDELRKIAAEVGMDVPFFIEGGMAIGDNFGEKITLLENINLKIKLIPRSANEKNKTENAYKNIDLSKCGMNLEKTKALIEGIKSNDLEKIKLNLHNDFEVKSHVEKEEHLSGSGPSTFILE